MTHNKKYSLGIYVNDWGFKVGSEGNLHMFLGLKIEKVKCNETQIQMQEYSYLHYLKHNMLEQANQCKINIEQMQCFINEKTLEDFKNELNEKYKYYLTSSKEFKAWQDTTLKLTKSINKNFYKALRESFNNDFIFLRQCYANIRKPFFVWIKNTKNIDDDYLKTHIGFDEFEYFFNEFIESSYSNLDSIDGSFGFGPVETAPNHWSKVYENNQYVVRAYL